MERSGGNIAASLNYQATFVLGLLWSLILAFLWQGEEPHKSGTILVTITVYFIGAATIGIAKRYSIIENQSAWMLVFLAKLTLSYIIVDYFWATPLEPNSMLRTPVQDSLTTDSNFYDYAAAQIANTGVADNIDVLYSTWLSFGIIAYVSLIYIVFGVSVFYVAMFNSLLTLLGAIALAGAIKCFDIKHPERWEAIRWTMLLPYCSYYDAIPSKEPLSSAFFYLAVFFSAKTITAERGSIKYVLLFLICFMLASIVRLNLGILLLLVPVFFMTKKVGALRAVGLLAVTLLLWYAAIKQTTYDEAAVVTALFNVQLRFEMMNEFFDILKESGAEVKIAVAGALMPTTIVDSIVLAPIRMAIWNYLPYPVVMPDASTLFQMPELLTKDWNRYFRAAESFMRLLSTWLLLLFTPHVIASLASPSSRTRNGYSFLLWNYLIPLILISNTAFIMGGRYRTLLEPLFIGLALWGKYNASSSIRVQWAFASYALFVIGIAGYYLWRIG